MGFDHESMAEVIRGLAYNAHSAVLVGNPAPVTEEFHRRMKDVQLGNLVVEVTTRFNRPAIDAVGTLEEMAHEPAFDEWDEEKEGEPCPEEPVWYIQTLDGRRFRWVNASFISVPWEFVERPA